MVTELAQKLWLATLKILEAAGAQLAPEVIGSWRENLSSRQYHGHP